MPPQTDFEEIKRMLAKNTDQLEENAQLLKKINRNQVFSFWIKVSWYVLLIGLPFALYYYILQPYFAALGSSYDTFSAGLQEIPGWKQFSEALTNFTK